MNNSGTRGTLGALLLALALALPASAQDRYLAQGAPDGVALLAAPPTFGSAEAAADLASVRAVFRNRTLAEEGRAKKDSALAFSLFAPATATSFNLTNLPQTKALLEQVKKEIGPVIDTPKNYWKRQRPYLLDSNLSLGAPEPSFSYPSGHSTRGTVYSMVIAELFPERKQAILAVGRDIGWDRVLIGKHFPTDVYAGRVLGKAIVRQLMASAEFEKDLAAAKAEIEASAKMSVDAVRSVRETPGLNSLKVPEGQPALTK